MTNPMKLKPCPVRDDFYYPADFLAAGRKRLGLTMAQMAERLQFAEDSYSALEYGLRHPTPRVFKLVEQMLAAL